MPTDIHGAKTRRRASLLREVAFRLPTLLEEKIRQHFLFICAFVISYRKIRESNE